MHSLDQYFIPAPLATLLTLVSGLSFVVVSDYAGHILLRRNGAISRALYFFSGLMLISWLTWLLALTGLADTLSFRLFLSVVIAFAAFIIVTKRASIPFPNAIAFIKTATGDRKRLNLTVALIVMICLGYTILSLAVPTDSDSLSYHLALPVDILQRGDLWFDKNQLHFRMAGFGEMLNVVGVASGCPQLGAFIQVLALFYFLEALTEGVEIADWLKSAILVLCIPTLLFLIPGQKHQLTAVLATSICFLAIQRAYRFDVNTFALWLTVLLFAAGIKYSQFLSGSALILLFLLKKPENISLLKFFTQLFLFTLIFLGPQFYFRWAHLGDPVSPLLESFIKAPDPVVQALHSYIKNYRESALPFPISLFVPQSLGRISTSLGISVLVICFLPFLRRWRAETACIALLVILIFAGGQLSARFFMEPVLWSIPVFVSVFGKSKWAQRLIVLPRLQSMLMVCMIIFGVYRLGPSIISDRGREQVLTQSADGFAESRWLHETLPKDARIATYSRSRAFLSENYFAWEYLSFTNMSDPGQVGTLRQKLAAQKIGYLILPTQGYQDFKDHFAGEMLSAPKKFIRATRNPFNETTYEVAIYKLRTE